MHLPNTLCTAATLYHELEDLLFPACEKITVAGSVRRHYTKRMREDFGRLIVNDVEIVCQPKMVRDGRNLFGECSALDGVLAELRSKGVLAGDPDRKADGERFLREFFGGPVDDFLIRELTDPDSPEFEGRSHDELSQRARSIALRVYLRAYLEEGPSS